MQKEMSNISKAVEILRNNQKEIVQIGKHNNRRMTLMRSSVDWIQPRKELISLRTYKQKFSKLKYKEKKRKRKSATDYLSSMGEFSKAVIKT